MAQEERNLCSTLPKGRELHARPRQSPVLLLVHGYPQTAFIWRHVAPFLKDKVSLCIPEIPGYGISSAPNMPIEFSTMGESIVSACKELFPDRPIIFGGHDRGARICHRAAVENAHWPEAPKVKLLGCIFLDIVPTLDQWKVFSDPKASVGYFHWPLLASPMAVMIMESLGGDKMTRAGLERLGGGNESARAKLKSDNAWDVYTSLYARRETIEGSCADYKAAAVVEPGLQTDDQKSERFIEVPTLVGWSASGLGSMHGDIAAIWRPWVKPGVNLRGFPCQDGVGHYLPEEASEVVAKEIISFLDEIHADT